MRERLAAGTVSPQSGRSSSREEIYGEVYREILESCQGEDREEFVALCPREAVMAQSFTRWKKELGMVKPKKKREVEAFDDEATPIVERDQTKVKFIVTTLARGKICHSLSNNLYRFNRYKVTPTGRAYFSCSVRGCKAVLRAEYTSYEARNLEEPSVQGATPEFSSHLMENGRVHPVQAGLRMAEEARRRMRNVVAENPAKPVPHIYKEVKDEIVRACEARDRDELVALFPPFEAMVSSLYRWRKEFAGQPIHQTSPILKE